MKWSRWFTDNLLLRLFLLMWVALVVSHLMAFMVVRTVHFSGKGPSHRPPGAEGGRFDNRPTFPSLPPMPGLPYPFHPDGGAGPGPGPRPPGERAGPIDRSMPPEAAGSAPRRAEGQGGMPPGGFRGSPPRSVLLLDYGVRLLVIALAAWLGSRWVARPMRRLAQASKDLGHSISRGARLPELDERSGTAEVRETAEVFNTMARQLQEQFEARGLMVAAISHDLRTPLTRMRMRLETMPEDSPIQQRCVADIREMDALINSVLEIFREDRGGLHERLQPTDISALVQALVDDLAEHGQAVVFSDESGEDAVAVAHAEPAALKRVVGNLISNALRYGKRAEVAVDADAQAVRIRVEDRGPGIPPAQLESVFKPFYRLESSRNRHTGGAGLGLYIARDLTERQGGQLLLSNREGGGLRADIVLPVRSGKAGTT